ncbi:MAG: NAD-dependent epimerase/dehydratase family protein [Chitinophagaceae bacterium]|nr:NAD-dependent epimerase/dehydratase family protein [Oligoflexus sp.]
MTIMVTGGGGFLGFALLKALKAEGHKLKTINRGFYPELETLGIEVLRGDLADYATVRAALEGVDTLFHVAAKPGVWGPYAGYFDANIKATLNILKVCRELGIKKLIYTSSPSVTFGGFDQENVDESTPYPPQFMAAYPETKAKAEQLVLEANDDDLATVSLRPHLIWGPGDRHLLPRIIDKASKRRLRFIGKPGKKVDAVYIDNAVEAHLCALKRLEIGSVISGKVYFIGNNEPMPMDVIINSILEAASLPQVTKRLSFRFAWTIATLLETFYTLFHIESEPPLTRFMVAQLNTAHWYNPKASQEELGFYPKVTMSEGFARLKQSLEQGRTPSKPSS